MVADARPQRCAAADHAKCRSRSKVDENAFSRKVAALEVAQNRVMSNFYRHDFERRCDLIAVRYLSSLVKIGVIRLPIVTSKGDYYCTEVTDS